MKKSDALPSKVVRELASRLQEQGLFLRPREAIIEAFAFTETGTVPQIARALGYHERVVQQTVDWLEANYGGPAQ
jgi:hypothetical protein